MNVNHNDDYLIKNIAFYYRLISFLVALNATIALGGYATLEQTVRCGGVTPDFKDSVEAAMRRRVPFGHVS